MAVRIAKVEEFVYGKERRHETTYKGTQAELIEARIVPPDFFNFHGPSRACSRKWYGKRIPSVHAFPDGVEHIRAERRRGLWLVEIWHNRDAPPYVPPGETWQRPEPKPKPGVEDELERLKRLHDFYRFHRLDDTGTASPRIGTGCTPRVNENMFTVTFSGTQEQLVNSGIATPAMFPVGVTPTGRPRDSKKSGKRSPMSWRVDRDGGLWRVRFYDVEPEESGLRIR